MADKNALRQVYEAIWPKAKEDHFTEEGMPEFGIRHFTDSKLENRLEAYRMLMQFINAKIEATTLNEYVDELRERLELLFTTINLIAGPYARAGDHADFAKLMHGCSQLYHIAYGFCLKAELYFANDEPIDMKKPVGMNHVVIHNLHLTMVNHVFPNLFDGINYCFRDPDVRPTAVTVVNSMMPYMGGESPEMITGSGGRTSEDEVAAMRKPDPGPYPQRMQNKP